MVRGTTPTYTFSVPFDTDLISNIKVNFSQEKLLVSKGLVDCNISEATIEVKLTQEDTLKFSQGEAEIVIRVLTKGNEAIASEPMHDYVFDCNDNEVLTDDTI